MVAMERRRVDLEIAELRIDSRKEEYPGQLGKQVSFDDILEVLGNEPRCYVLSAGGRIRYNILGPNNAGRYLLTAIGHVEATVWRVITAHWMEERRARRDYDGGETT